MWYSPKGQHGVLLPRCGAEGGRLRGPLHFMWQGVAPQFAWLLHDWGDCAGWDWEAHADIDAGVGGIVAMLDICKGVALHAVLT